ncbi:putative transposase, partial [Escherichia coli PA38]
PDELIDFTFEWKGLKKLCVAVSFRSIIAEQQNSRTAEQQNSRTAEQQNSRTKERAKK